MLEGQDEILDGFGYDHPGLGRGLTAVAFMASFTAPRVTHSRSATRTSDSPWPESSEASVTSSGPKLPCRMATPRLSEDERDGLPTDGELVCQLIDGVAVFVPRDEILDLIVS